MRQLVYTMFISNNSASFHLWWKENLIKYQKVSKYYANDCRYNINSFRVGTCALENHSFIHLSCITDATQGGTFKQFFFNLTIKIAFEISKPSVLNYLLNWTYLAQCLKWVCLFYPQNILSLSYIFPTLPCLPSSWNFEKLKEKKHIFLE